MSRRYLFFPQLLIFVKNGRNGRASKNRMSTGCDKLSRPDRAIIGDPTYSRECMKLDVSINFHALKACSIKHSIVTRPPADFEETPIYSSLYSFASHAFLRKQIHYKQCKPRS